MTETSVNATRPGRWRRWRLFLLLSILLLLVGYIGLDWWTGRQLDAELARLQPKYGDLRSWTAASPAVPAAENRARLVRAAAALLILDTVGGKFQFARFGKMIEADTVAPESRELVERNGEALRLAATFTSRRQSSWEVDYGTEQNTLPLIDARTLSNVIYLKAMMELEANRPDEAVRAIMAGLAAAASFNQEPQLVTQLIRIAMDLNQFVAIQRVLVKADPTTASLEDLARWLKESRATDPMAIGLRAELAFGNSALTRLAAGRGALSPDASPERGMFGRIGRSIVRIGHVRYLRNMDRLLAVQAGPRPLPAKQLFVQPSPWHLIDRFAGVALPGLERAVQTGDEFLASLGACEIAVALRRYRLDHGSYPDNLTALVPVYLDRLPINPFTGKVPVYERSEKGFTLQAPHSGADQVRKTPLANWKIDR